MAPSRSRRLREPAGTSATGDARGFCGFSWWEGAIPGFAPIPIGFIGELTSIDLFWLHGGDHRLLGEERGAVARQRQRFIFE